MLRRSLPGELLRSLCGPQGTEREAPQENAPCWPAAMAGEAHPVPSRTRKLSPLAPMVLRSESVGEQDAAAQQGAFSMCRAPGRATALAGGLFYVRRSPARRARSPAPEPPPWGGRRPAAGPGRDARTPRGRSPGLLAICAGCGSGLPVYSPGAGGFPAQNESPVPEGRRKSPICRAGLLAGPLSREEPLWRRGAARGADPSPNGCGR